jgi:hypothetical protein
VSWQFTDPRFGSTAETLLVIAVMAGGYRISGRIIRRRTAASTSAEAAPTTLVDA